MYEVARVGLPDLRNLLGFSYFFLLFLLLLHLTLSLRASPPPSFSILFFFRFRFLACSECLRGEKRARSDSNRLIGEKARSGVRMGLDGVQGLEKWAMAWGCHSLTHRP
jgi:hypothetical protein